MINTRKWVDVNVTVTMLIKKNQWQHTASLTTAGLWMVCLELSRWLFVLQKANGDHTTSGLICLSRESPLMSLFQVQLNTTEKSELPTCDAIQFHVLHTVEYADFR